MAVVLAGVLMVVVHEDEPNKIFVIKKKLPIRDMGRKLVYCRFL